MGLNAALGYIFVLNRKRYLGGHGGKVESFLRHQLSQYVNDIQVLSIHCILFKLLYVFPVLQRNTDLQNTKNPFNSSKTPLKMPEEPMMCFQPVLVVKLSDIHIDCTAGKELQLGSES